MRILCIKEHRYACSYKYAKYIHTHALRHRFLLRTTVMSRISCLPSRNEGGKGGRHVCRWHHKKTLRPPWRVKSRTAVDLSVWWCGSRLRASLRLHGGATSPLARAVFLFFVLLACVFVFDRVLCVFDMDAPLCTSPSCSAAFSPRGTHICTTRTPPTRTYTTHLVLSSPQSLSTRCCLRSLRPSRASSRGPSGCRERYVGTAFRPPPRYTVCSLGYCGLFCVILSSTIYSSKYIYRTDNMILWYAHTCAPGIEASYRRKVLFPSLCLYLGPAGGCRYACQNSTLCRSRCCESMHMPMMVRVATPPYPLP